MAPLNAFAPEFNPFLISSLPYLPYQHPSSNPNFYYSSTTPCCFPALHRVERDLPHLSIYNSSFNVYYMDLPWPDPLIKSPFHHDFSWDSLLAPAPPLQQPLPPCLLPSVHVHAQVAEEDESRGLAAAEVVAPRRVGVHTDEKVTRALRHHRRRVVGLPCHFVHGKGTHVWKPKREGGESCASVEFHERKTETTLMIRNIPNKYTREMLLELLDKHCLEENEKLGLEADDSNGDFSGYDFAYLPIDFGTRCNLGYAFVNLTCAPAACRLQTALHKHKWAVFGSKKICEISYAKIQGKEALENHFTISTFVCDSDEFLPITFSPYRNGSCSYQASTIGNRITPARPFQPTSPSQ